MTVLAANGDFYVPSLGQPMHVTNYPSIVSSPSNSLTFPLGAASVSAPGLTVNGYNSFAYISGA